MYFVRYFREIPSARKAIESRGQFTYFLIKPSPRRPALNSICDYCSEHWDPFQNLILFVSVINGLNNEDLLIKKQRRNVVYSNATSMRTTTTTAFKETIFQKKFIKPYELSNLLINKLGGFINADTMSRRNKMSLNWQWTFRSFIYTTYLSFSFFHFRNENSGFWWHTSNTNTSWIRWVKSWNLYICEMRPSFSCISVILGPLCC